MGTKNNPGKFDCYAAAKPDEPMFVLLARDPIAPQLVQIWAAVARLLGKDPEKIKEAQQCAEAMRAYLGTHGKQEFPVLAAIESTFTVGPAAADEEEPTDETSQLVLPTH